MRACFFAGPVRARKSMVEPPEARKRKVPAGHSEGEQRLAKPFERLFLGRPILIGQAP